MRSSESPAHRVQILDDIHQSFDSTNTLGRNSAHVTVCSVKPGTRLGIVATDERIERSIQPEEKRSELRFGALRIESAPGFQARHKRLAGPDDLSELLVLELQSLRCCHRSFRENGSRLGCCAGDCARHCNGKILTISCNCKWLGTPVSCEAFSIAKLTYAG